jgi:hypothetical protein
MVTLSGLFLDGFTIRRVSGQLVELCKGGRNCPPPSLDDSLDDSPAQHRSGSNHLHRPRRGDVAHVQEV